MFKIFKMSDFSWHKPFSRHGSCLEAWHCMTFYAYLLRTVDFSAAQATGSSMTFLQ